MKLLFLDIETAPNSAFVWGLWNQNIGINQMIDSSKVLCWAAKWKDDKKVIYSGIDTDDHDAMIAKMHILMDQADVVCTYNGNRFDIPTLHKEFVILGLPPPAPSKSLDLFRIVRKNFKFPSNKLDYVAQKLGIGGKVKHEGFELWIKCMNNDETAWKKMQKYNKQDVILLEKLYERILPWLSGHINRNLYADGGDSCPTCGSHRLQRRGFSVSLTGRNQRFQCQDCGGWSKSSKTEKLTETKGAV
jgi:uncharacterized protein YprB with RNaseH-like and TPR domain